ncbi:hypothetical protein ABXS75_02105 [Roseburia hominis]
MMKKLYDILRIFQWGFIGTFIGKSLYQYWDYKSHPALYAAQSAPWYLSIKIHGIFTAIIVAVILIVRWLIKRKMK